MKKVTTLQFKYGKHQNRKQFKYGKISKSMSEELIQKGYTEHGLIIGNYEFYNIGRTNLTQLAKFKIIPKKNYGKYKDKEPDAILVDRRNKNRIKVLLVIEHKNNGKFSSPKDKEKTLKQCNTYCQVLNSDIGIATDNSSFIWINPKEENSDNLYKDEFGKDRSYNFIKDENGSNFIKEFLIDQKENEKDITKLNVNTRLTLQKIELIKKSISTNNSQLKKDIVKNPNSLAKQIWQDVWSVSGATPEKCLYTFVELFIFKYLSDLEILDEDDNGVKINFRDIYSLSPEKAFKNYSNHARKYLKVMFPESKEDGTTIINGTVLNPEVPEHSTVFYKILKKFNDFGELKNIDPSFKSQVFEDFMKESISKKNWGQFFTPRNIVDAIIEISDIEKLPEDAEICDPACGVGGFILEPIKVKENGLKFYYKVQGDEIKSRYNFIGYDKGFEREEQLTVILAKANMLIFLSDLLKTNPTMAENFADLFNSTFKLQHKTILGTLARTEKDKYDLILTNPPYVTSGSSNYKDTIKKDGELSKFFKVNAMGVEGLFLEWIIRSLKPSKKAFIIIPDGVLNRGNDKKLRQFIQEECMIDGIISLPINTFYTTPKKTYILAITKKPEKSEIERKENKQTDPIFSYLVTNIGETLDINRFKIPENDLTEMVSLFNQFKGAKKSFKSNSLRCKIINFEDLDIDDWCVDRLWGREEKEKLGIAEDNEVLSVDEFKERVLTLKNKIDEIYSELKNV